MRRRGHERSGSFPEPTEAPMCTLLFVRHVEHVHQHTMLLGRTHDAPFTDYALKQLDTVANSLQNETVGEVYSSPRRRAVATAQTIASAFALPVRIRDDLDELDYGDWSGRAFEELAHDPRWQRWNALRSSECPPNGESMRALQTRVV